MRRKEALGTNQRNLLAMIRSVGVPSILPTDRRTLQTAKGLARLGLIQLQPLDLLALDGSEVFVVSLPGETLETHAELLA